MSGIKFIQVFLEISQEQFELEDAQKLWLQSVGVIGGITVL